MKQGSDVRHTWPKGLERLPTFMNLQQSKGPPEDSIKEGPKINEGMISRAQTSYRTYLDKKITS